MKRLKKKLVLMLGVAVMMIGSSFVAVFGADTTYLDVYVSGRSGDYSYYQLKKNTNSRYQVDLNYPSGRDRIVLKTELQNSNREARGYCDIYEGTTNYGDNWAASGYSYRLFCLRQYDYDPYARVTGHWFLN